MSTIARSDAEAQRAEAMMEDCECFPDEWVGMMRAGDLDDAPHASTWVCGRDAHQAAAKAWVEALTGLPGRLIERKPA